MPPALFTTKDRNSIRLEAEFATHSRSMRVHLLQSHSGETVSLDPQSVTSVWSLDVDPVVIRIVFAVPIGAQHPFASARTETR